MKAYTEKAKGKAPGRQKAGRKASGPAPKKLSEKSKPEKPFGAEKKRSVTEKKAFRPKAERTEATPSPDTVEGVICGRNAVLEAIKSGQTINKVLLAQETEAAFAASVFRLCKAHNIPCHQVPRPKLTAFAGKDHHGIAAEMAAIPYVEIEDILARANEKGQKPFVLVLDGVEDPHNLGAVIRTALCVGAHGLVLPRNRAAAVNQTVMKTSAGGAAYLPIARVTNLNQAIGELQKAGLWVIAADMDGKPMWETDLTGPLALVLGAEGQGVSPLVKKNCDMVVSVPMQGPLDSLNISNAAAVLMYEALRQQQGK